MSNKTNNSSSKSICERYNKHNCAFYSCKTNKIAHNSVRKVIPSRNFEQTSSNEVKSCSTGVINNIKKVQVSKSRKVTKSDMRFDSNKSVIDFCTKCGDSKSEKNRSRKYFNSNSTGNRNELETQVFIDQERRNKKVGEKKNILHEYYKNENFKPTANENRIKNSTLDPIRESSETRGMSEDYDSISDTYTESVEEIGFLDPKDDKNIKDLKDFRKNNYFECHSAKARVSSKGSVTSLNDHKCVYRFYLNERLFPIPLNTDYRKDIRCMDCHLPLRTDANSGDSERINGTIQTKVKIGKEVQDLTLMLPVKQPLIIQQARTLKDDKENDIIYFGIVKLSCTGDSLFCPNLPNNSLALRYQKGYKEFINNGKYEYERIKEDDIIII